MQVSQAFAEAVMLYEQGECAGAARRCETILHQDPGESAALHLLGLIALERGDRAAAAELLNQAVTSDPHNAEIWNDLGNALQLAGEVPAAKKAFQRASELAPTFAAAHSNFGYMLFRQGDFAASLEPFQRAIATDPQFALAYSNLGSALLEMNEYTAAMQIFEQAIATVPQDAAAYVNLGHCLRRLDSLPEARDVLQRGLQVAPRRADLWLNLSGIEKESGDFSAALRALDIAISLQPRYAEAHWNRALLLLAQGNWEDGWEAFEWRRQISKLAPLVQPAGIPEWTGQLVDGKSILLLAEQGIGDTLQFIRYAVHLKDHGAHVVAAVQPEVIPILRSNTAIDELVPLRLPLPRCDYYVPLLSLPRLLTPSLDLLPQQSEYLAAPATLIEHWKRELQQLPGIKIGIGWQGNPRYAADRHRSVPLRCFEPLGKTPGVSLISLQRGFGTEQLPEARKSFPIVELGKDIDEKHGPFVDTAAIASNLDLVISSDTALVHLAGAVGAPVWMPTAHVPDWRWMLERTNSPWYPRLRLFRQTRAGDWGDVIERMRVALAKFITEK